jgi:3-dehydroquinate synthase
LTGRLSEPEWQRIIAVFEAVGLPIWDPHMAVSDAAGRPAGLAGLDEFREHLGGRLTVMLLEGVGCGFEVHHLDEAVIVEASELLRRRATAEGELDQWRPTPALAR